MSSDISQTEQSNGIVDENGQISDRLNLSRRDFGRLAAGSAAAAVGIGYGASRVEAGLVDGVRSSIRGAAGAAKDSVETDSKLAYGVAAFHPGALAGLIAYNRLRDDVNEDVTEDQAIVHGLLVSEYESLTTHEVVMGNRLKDARPIANLEARHGIATAWEEGRSSSEALDDALSRIRQYYELPEFNHYHVTNKSLLQLSYAAGAADSTGYTDWVATIGEGDDDTNYQLRMIDERESVSIELHDGTDVSNVDPDEADDVLGNYETAALEVPMLEVRDTDADDVDSSDALVDTVPILSQEVVDSWDDDEETVTFDVDGVEIETSLQFAQPSIGDPEDDGQPSTRVFDGVEFFKLLEEIESQSDTVVGNYDQSLVDDLYAELEAGNITPEQVRSPEGMVHFLSDTEDASNSRYRIGMLQQLGLEQPDFRRVSGMEITASGATGRWVDPDPDLDYRHVHPDDFVADETYSGVLFGDDLPDGGFETGQTYLVGPSLYSVGSSELVSFDYLSRERQWSIDISGSGFEIAPDRDTVFVSDGSDIVALDVSDGSERWRFTDPSSSASMLHYDHGYLAVSADDLHLVDPDDGSEIWSRSVFGGGPRALVGDDAVYAGDFEDDVTYRFSLEDGSTDWTTDDSQWASDIGLTPDYVLTVARTANDAFITDRESGEVLETLSMDDPVSVGYDEHRNLYLFGGGDGDIEARNLDDESFPQEWSASISSEVDDFTMSPDGETLYVIGGGELYDVNPDNGTVDSDPWSASHSFNSAKIAGHQTDIDSLAGRAIMMDEENNEEFTLSNATVTIDKKFDADGATLTHVDEQTIEDIEAEVGEDIETIVDEMDRFDSVDDIQYIVDIEAILDHYDSDATIGNDDDADVRTQDTDYSRPKYDSYDSAEFAEYVSELEEKIEQLESEEEETTGGGGGGGGDNSAIVLGFAAILAAGAAAVGLGGD